MAATTLKSGLEEVERDDDKRLPFLLTKVEIKLLCIAGVRPAFLRAVAGILRLSWKYSDRVLAGW